MLVLVSFVLVLAAAVTLVVGLLQSGLTLIYLSIACSVLAGVVLAVAVLRGRPEPKAAPVGRSYTAPAAAPPPPVPASVGAPSTPSTSSWSPPTPAPPPPPPPAIESGPSDDAATKAAGAALLGRLRGRKAGTGDATPAPATDGDTDGDVEVQPMVVGSTDVTAQMPAAGEPGDDFPVPDYERLRANELLAKLPDLDRNQLEVVRDREAAGKNRFTVLARIDGLLAAKSEPDWDAADDEWQADEEADEAHDEEPPYGAGADDDEPEVLVAEAAAADDEWESDDAAFAMGAGSSFPIADYDSLTVGQILPRLSSLDAEELAQVRAREEMGRRRSTILERVDRMAARSAPSAMAMPAAPPARARKSPARKAAAGKAAAGKAAAAEPAKRARAGASAPAPRKGASRQAATEKASAPKVAAPRKAAKRAAPTKKAAATTKAGGAKKARKG